MVLYGSAEHVGDFPRSPSRAENVVVSQSESGAITASTSRTTVVIILNEYISVMLRFPNFDFRSISIRFLAQNDDFDSIQF